MYFSPRLAGLKAPCSLAAALGVKAEGTASKLHSPGPGQRKGTCPVSDGADGTREGTEVTGQTAPEELELSPLPAKEPKSETIQLKFALAFGGFLTEKPKSPSLLHARRIAVTFKANPARQHFPASGTRNRRLQSAASPASPKRAAKAERLLLRRGGTTSILCRLLPRNSSIRGVPLPPEGTTPPQEGPSSGPAVTRALPDGNGMPTKSALNFSLHLLVRLPKVLNNKSAYFQP